ncbi:hypothetical protein [Paenibacillus odorifer]|uniref:hypothetical protein n=1 Tax=Paenibacillus TaxID=44249 RepID=UPI00096CC3D7|nr:hypothetical protein [Paenibacillus odorifer]OME26355.1 hypothetical protein BSK57_08665 [Paenibacillus odorifer]OME35795.1 hypothetical protein BSK63_05580 [Paenibacillus odorifer]OME40713.1 hypothetical protein BSK46_06765 [Paenibacillus odorifer]
MSFESKVAKTAARCWFDSQSKEVVSEGSRYILGEDYAIFVSGREHSSLKKHEPKTSANYKPSEFMNFEDKVLMPKGIHQYHFIIARTYGTPTRDPDWCYLISVPYSIVTKRAQLARDGIERPEDNLYFYFDQEGGRGGKYGIRYWQNHSTPVKYQRFNPNNEESWNLGETI